MPLPLSSIAAASYPSPAFNLKQTTRFQTKNLIVAPSPRETAQKSNLYRLPTPQQTAHWIVTSQTSQRLGPDLTREFVSAGANFASEIALSPLATVLVMQQQGFSFWLSR